MSNICEICGEVFLNGRIKSNHVRWKHKKDVYSKKGWNIMKIEKPDRKYGKLKLYNVICANEECKKHFQVKEREKSFPKKERYFCSISCANKRCHSKETKNKIAKSVSIISKKLWQDPIYIEKQLKNNKRKFTSKGEEEIRQYFIDKYPNDEWTFGGHLIIDEVGLIRDLYSNKLKICVEYNGIWHYKDIHGQLAEKQLKDKKLKKWCKINGYKLIIVKDDDYRKNKEKVLQLLEKKIYENTNT